MRPRAIHTQPRRPGNPARHPLLGRRGTWLLVLWALPACLFVTREEGEHMQAQLDALRGQLGDLNGQMARTASAQATTAERLASAQNEQQAMRRSGAELGAQIEHVQADLQRVQGAVEINEHQLKEAEERLQQELGNRLLALKQTSAREEKDAASQAVQRAAPRNRKDLLQYGLALLGGGQREDGRGILRDVVRRHGKVSGIGDEALRGLAAAAFGERRYEASLRDWVRLVDTFPRSSRAAEAYFHVAACSQALGRNADAKTFFQEVVTNYPRTPWAKQARARLTQLSGSPAAKPAVPVKPTPPAEPRAVTSEAETAPDEPAEMESQAATPAPLAPAPPTPPEAPTPP